MNLFETTFLKLGAADRLSIIFDTKHLALHHLVRIKSFDTLTKILLLVKPCNRLIFAYAKNELGDTFLHTMGHRETPNTVYRFLMLFEKDDRIEILYEWKNNDGLSLIDIITQQSIFTRSSKLKEHKQTPAERAGMLL